ncbi:Metallo-dependent hydrolase [Hypoxylon cercidicola]|nr:Metallo-dependent hydrolase [Hypoxylon cercidicola]
MGFCGLDKEGDADQHEKTTSNQIRRRSGSLHFRQIFDKITTKLFNLVSEQPLDHSRHDAMSQATFKFQNGMMNNASLEEKNANTKLLEVRQNDIQLYSASQEGGNGEIPFAEDHFTRNLHIIKNTGLFGAARIAPKGTHLHVHFNSTLLPNFLLDIAKEMPNMYISSPTHKLRSKSDFDNCEIVFTLQDSSTVMMNLPDGLERQKELFSKDSKGPNLFHDIYEKGQKMRYQYFRTMWDAERKLRHNSRESDVWTMDMECDDWLTSKLMFTKEDVELIFHPKDKLPDAPWTPETKEEEQIRQKKAEDAGWPKDIELAYHNSPYNATRKRATRAWAKFNGRTRMMKGLFNYEKAFRAYTRRCLEEFIRDNVQYAEIRPNFMKSNQVLRDSGSGSFNNFGLMEIIIEEYENFMKDIGDMAENGQIIENRELDSQGRPIYSDSTGIPRGNGHRPSLSGMKVIYCTPRSFPKAMVKDSLAECIQMKKKWPQYIAGFDLVGEESYDKPYPLRFFEEEFKQFQENCRKEQVEIPFLFHCGETPDDIEGNLECALDLQAKRIGHGYALPHKPDVMRQMKANNVCVEACPISNMVLGLVERMDEHRIYELLAHEVHCALSSDNGTLFGSTLSHDFYEVMVGNQNMNLYGWHQLARWSIDHACLSPVERERMLVEWQRRWTEEFIPEVLGGQSSLRLARLGLLAKAEEKRQERVGRSNL